MYNEILTLLDDNMNALQQSFPITWRYPKKAEKNPLKAVPRKSWKEWSYGDSSILRKNRKNWFYGEVVFPEKKNGIDLAGAEAWFFVNGWCPFTLWLDGKEIFKETHAWHATGPIGDPIVTSIEPGRKYRLILCLKPTELPTNFNVLNVSVNSRHAIHTAVDVAAAAAQLRFANAISQDDSEKQLVERAAAKLDHKALANQDWEKVRKSITEMESALMPLSDRAKSRLVHLIGHTHIDMDWMWTWDDTVHCIRRDFKAVADMMDDYPDVTFTHSQVPTYHVVQQMDPEIFEKVKLRIREGRWENAAGTWVEGDLNMADGESVARHMLYAADWTRANLDSKAKVLWEPDTFGHPGNMPQLAKLGEHDCYFHMRCNPGIEANWPIRIWEGVDGTKIPAFSLIYLSTLQPEMVMKSVISATGFGFRNSFHIWGLGDHGGGIPRFQLSLLERYRDKPLIPSMKFSTMQQLMDAVLAEGTEMPSNKGMTYSVFEGCFTTHALIKQYNRQCETALLTAEALCALARLDRRKELAESWQNMLFNHFHDIFDGAAVHDAYDNAYQRAEQSLAISQKVQSEALKLLVKPSRSGKTLTLINPLGFQRAEPVSAQLPKNTKCLKTADEQILPVQHKEDAALFIAEGIPAFGLKSYEILTQKPEGMQDVSVSEEDRFYKIDTPLATVHIAKSSGAISSYYDKRLKRDFVAYGLPKPIGAYTTRTDMALNVFQLIDEAPNRMSAWLIYDNLKQENLLQNAEVTLVETGPVFARFKVVHKIRSSRIDQNIFIYNQSPRIDFETTVDWREKGSDEVGIPQLKVSFAASISAPRARFEGPFFITERPADGIEQPTGKWVDVSGDECGFAIYNDSRHGCDVLGGRVRLTLLRNSYGPDPESDNGIHTIRFAFDPHGPEMPNAELFRAGMAFNRPTLAVRTGEDTMPETAMMQIEGTDSIVCTSMRPAEHSDRLLLRFFETDGKPCSARISIDGGAASAEEVNFLENPTGGKVDLQDGRMTLTFRPFEVKTILIEGCRLPDRGCVRDL